MSLTNNNLVNPGDHKNQFHLLLVMNAGFVQTSSVDQDAPSPKVPSDQSSSSDVIHTIVPSDHQVSKHNRKWTKDHPLENITGVISAYQFPHDCTKPMNKPYTATIDSFSHQSNLRKDALTQACWIEAMQEELHEFERLEVWELVPPPDKAFVITLKWIYKVKLAELERLKLYEIFLAFAAHMNKVVYQMDVQDCVSECGYSHGGEVQTERIKKGTVVDPSHKLWYDKAPSFILQPVARPTICYMSGVPGTVGGSTGARCSSSSSSFSTSSSSLSSSDDSLS
ncbi:retrovirus-related pol polyprotein from transposon TNT 1-94 [Tanacetum coccineum]